MQAALLQMCVNISRGMLKSVNILNDLKEGMTNLLSSWLGLRSKWEVKRLSRGSNVSGFLKRKQWLQKDDVAIPVTAACMQKCEDREVEENYSTCIFCKHR